MPAASFVGGLNFKMGGLIREMDQEMEAESEM
jgi:hypothetical protein